MNRVSPKEGKLLYHLTTMKNIESIIKNGLLPRNELVKSGIGFDDTANYDILERRSEKDLGNYVPFHFFIKNPYDGAQFKKHPSVDFVYIVITRISLAQSGRGFVIPKHPLSEAMHTLEVLPYEEGFNKIDWALIAKRDYSNQECKKACMCEALHEGVVSSNMFTSINVKTSEDKEKIDIMTKEHGLKCYVNLSDNWFLNDDKLYSRQSTVFR